MVARGSMSRRRRRRRIVAALALTAAAAVAMCAAAVTAATAPAKIDVAHFIARRSKFFVHERKYGEVGEREC